jgi:hypothetical protein
VIQTVTVCVSVFVIVNTGWDGFGCVGIACGGATSARVIAPSRNVFWAVSAPGASPAGSIITACGFPSVVGAGVDAADADAVPLRLGLVASNAETNPLEAMIATMTTASASVLTNRGVIGRTIEISTNIG